MFAMVIAGGSKPCFADWTKTIDCPDGRVYRDIRRDAGREEFCEVRLPGSLKVRDGPSRWWYSEGHFGEEGTYEAGRKVGRWRECDRFDRCRDQSYELLYPLEKARGVKPEIPVSYSRRKYVFDFNSCWSTWVTRQTTESLLELNIGGGLIRCQITYIPSIDKDRPAGNQGHYLCEIPYTVGVREFDSLDLKKELPKAGLPQFCRQDDPPVTASEPNGPAAQAIALWVNTRFLDARTGKEVRGWTTLANMVDVECAALARQQPEPDRLTVRLNEYAEKLVLERIGKDEIKADTCGGRFPLSTIETTRGASGRTLFTYGLSQNRTTAERQHACITTQIKLQPTCALR
jgi:hypothetical protein